MKNAETDFSKQKKAKVWIRRVGDIYIIIIDDKYIFIAEQY